MFGFRYKSIVSIIRISGNIKQKLAQQLILIEITKELTIQNPQKYSL